MARSILLSVLLCLSAGLMLMVQGGDPTIFFEWNVTYGTVAPLGIPVKAGGFGGLRVNSRPLIPVPYDEPADDYTIIAGDWFNKGHTTLKRILDSGRNLGRADGVHINGKVARGDGKDEPLFTMEAGKTVETGRWSPEKRMNYNLLDAVNRHTIQVGDMGQTLPRATALCQHSFPEPFPEGRVQPAGGRNGLWRGGRHAKASTIQQLN
ncbi:hypothetical protein V6N13_139430 [Hibiscus sabdariffa]